MLCQKDRNITPDYFVQKVTPKLRCEKSRFPRWKTLVEYDAHGQFNVPQWRESDKRLGQGKRYPAPHPVYSPGLSPRDSWLFGMAQNRMTDRQPQSPKDILDAVTERWDEVTLKSLKTVSWHGWSDCNGHAKWRQVLHKLR
jgi:hypothetical protein